MGNQSFRKSETDKYFQRSFRSFEIRKATAGFYNTDNKKQHQQRITDGLQGAVNTCGDVP